jgi:hypothetical protein
MNHLLGLTFRVAKSTASKLSRHHPQGELEVKETVYVVSCHSQMRDEELDGVMPSGFFPFHTQCSWFLSLGGAGMQSTATISAYLDASQTFFNGLILTSWLDLQIL